MFTKIMKVLTAACFLVLAFVAVSEAQVCEPAPNGLVSWWPADGNALDPRSRNNGTLENGATFAAGHVGQAFSFDGVDDAVNAGNPASLQITGAITVEAWFRTTGDISNFRTLVSKWSSSPEDASYSMFFGTSEGLRFGINNGTTFLGADSGLTNLNDGAWHHAAGTWDGTTIKIYVDGIERSSATNAGFGLIANTSNPVKIGTDNRNIPDRFFNGQIDEPAIYNRALSDTEILAIFNAGTAGKCKPTATVPPACLIGWWPGDNNTNDISGNGNHGTLQNGATLAPAKVQQGFNFTALNQRVEIPDNSSLDLTTSVTLEAWVAPSQSGEANGGTTFISKSDLTSVNNQSYGLVYSNAGEVLMRVGNNTSLDQTASATILPLNTFSHVVGTYDGTSIKIYINGVLESQKSTALGTMVTNNLPVVIGANNLSGFVGQIDEATIYNCALTEDEITSIFNAGSAGKLKPLAPTAASVSVSGRVVTADGRGIARTTISLARQNGEVRTAISNAFGYYRFDGVTAGETYMVGAASKGNQFADNPRTILVTDELADLDFTALP